MDEIQSQNMQRTIKLSRRISFCLMLFTTVLLWHLLAGWVSRQIKNAELMRILSPVNSSEYVNKIRLLTLESRRNYYLIFLIGLVILLCVFALLWAKLWRTISVKPGRLHHALRISLLATLVFLSYQAVHLPLLRLQGVLIPYFRNPVATFYLLLVAYGVLLILCIVATQLISARMVQRYSAALANEVNQDTVFVKLS